MDTQIKQTDNERISIFSKAMYNYMLGFIIREKEEEWKKHCAWDFENAWEAIKKSENKALALGIIQKFVYACEENSGKFYTQQEQQEGKRLSFTQGDLHDVFTTLSEQQKDSAYKLLKTMFIYMQNQNGLSEQNIRILTQKFDNKLDKIKLKLQKEKKKKEKTNKHQNKMNKNGIMKVDSYSSLKEKSEQFSDIQNIIRYSASHCSKARLTENQLQEKVKKQQQQKLQKQINFNTLNNDKECQFEKQGQEKQKDIVQEQSNNLYDDKPINQQTQKSTETIKFNDDKNQKNEEMSTQTNTETININLKNDVEMNTDQLIVSLEKQDQIYLDYELQVVKWEFQDS